MPGNLVGPTVGKLPAEDIDTPAKVAALTGYSIPELRAMTKEQRALLPIIEVEAATAVLAASSSEADEHAARMARVRQAAVFDDAPMRAAQERRKKVAQRRVPGFVDEDDGQEDERWESLTEENRGKRLALRREESRAAEAEAKRKAARDTIKEREDAAAKAKEQRRRDDKRKVKEKEKRRKAAALAKERGKSTGGSLLSRAGLAGPSKAERKREKMRAKKQRKKARTPEAIAAAEAAATAAKVEARRVAKVKKAERAAAGKAERAAKQRSTFTCCRCIRGLVAAALKLALLASLLYLLAPLGRELLAPFPRDGSPDAGLTVRWARGVAATKLEGAQTLATARECVLDPVAREKLLADVADAATAFAPRAVEGVAQFSAQVAPLFSGVREGFTKTASAVYGRAAKDVGPWLEAVTWANVTARVGELTATGVAKVQSLLNADASTATVARTVDEVLAANGLGKYATELRALGVDDVAGLCLLAEGDLDATTLAAKPIHKRKLMQLVSGVFCTSSSSSAEEL